MRALFVTSRYPPDGFGGYGRVAESAVAWLRSRGHDVRVLTVAGRLSRAARAGPPGLARLRRRGPATRRRRARVPLRRSGPVGLAVGLCRAARAGAGRRGGRAGAGRAARSLARPRGTWRRRAL